MASSRVILQKMLDRLFAALVSGPGMNCRPHSSRQRMDVSQLSRLLDLSPEAVLRKLLGEERAAKLSGHAARPKREIKKKEEGSSAIELSEEERRIARQWTFGRAGLCCKWRQDNGIGLSEGAIVQGHGRLSAPRPNRQKPPSMELPGKALRVPGSAKEVPGRAMEVPGKALKFIGKVMEAAGKV